MVGNNNLQEGIMSKVWDRLPKLEENFDKGIVMCFCDEGLIMEPTELQKEKITKEEKELSKYGYKVIAILDQTANFPDEKVRMQCYVYVDKQSVPWIIDKKNVGFMALVVNEAWGVEESGSIGVVEINGWLRRTM